MQIIWGILYKYVVVKCASNPVATLLARVAAKIRKRLWNDNTTYIP